MIPESAVALAPAVVSSGARREFAQTRLGLNNISIIANVNIDAALRLKLFNFTNFSGAAPRIAITVKLVGAI
ncbi:MAG: hypothetical protein DMF63_02105 [Acidobacteria bacterium]|nr:MAG: hypothetical protein DMF63_02105 [Acidobacteriota bacterium]